MTHFEAHVASSGKGSMHSEVRGVLLAGFNIFLMYTSSVVECISFIHQFIYLTPLLNCRTWVLGNSFIFEYSEGKKHSV